jgi:hypothetical protein
MQPLESVGVVKATPKVAMTVKAPENATVQISQAAVDKQHYEARTVNPNDKKYGMYNQYEREANQTTQEQDMKNFRSTMYQYLTRSQGLIESGDSKAAADHIEQLMNGFNFNETSSVVIEMYRLLNYVHENINLNGLGNNTQRQSLAGIIRNLKDGFYDE